MKIDRLLLVVMGNLMLALAFIEAMENTWGSALGVASFGIILHIHFWRGGRFLIKLWNGNDEK